MSDKMTAAEYQEYHKARHQKGPTKVVWTQKKEVIGNRVYIKPLSANRAWKGKRFKSDEYRIYESELLNSLPELTLPSPPYILHLQFGFSSLSADGDNALKQTQDILSKKYGFNDKLIKRWIIDVESVKKGFEYVEFKIEHLIK